MGSSSDPCLIHILGVFTCFHHNATSAPSVPVSAPGSCSHVGGQAGQGGQAGHGVAQCPGKAFGQKQRSQFPAAHAELVAGGPSRLRLENST